MQRAVVTVGIHGVRISEMAPLRVMSGNSGDARSNAAVRRAPADLDPGRASVFEKALENERAFETKLDAWSISLAGERHLNSFGHLIALIGACEFQRAPHHPAAAIP